MGRIDDALQRLGARNEPALLRVPISHFSRKADWGLSHAGIPFSSLDVPYRHFDKVRRANPREGTVPVLATNEGVIHGSSSILHWADARRRADAPSLYPDDQRTDVEDWEARMDDVGQMVLREAYRTFLSHPELYAKTWTRKVGMRLVRTRMQRFLDERNDPGYDATDAGNVRRALEDTVARLRKTDTGYLFTDQPTAADIATAALLAPCMPIAKLRGHDGVDGWGEFVQYVRTVKPNRSRRTGKRAMKEADWRAFETLLEAGAVLERPLEEAAVIA